MKTGLFALMLLFAMAAASSPDYCKAIARPTSGTYKPPAYEPGRGVSRLHTAVPEGCNLINDVSSDKCKDFYFSIAAPAFAHLVLGLVVLILVWPIYMCCYNSGKCRCCGNGKPITLTIALLVVFAAILITSYIPFQGRSQFVDGIESVGEAIDLANATLSEFRGSLGSMSTNVGHLQVAGFNVAGSNTNFPEGECALNNPLNLPQIESANQEARGYGNEIETAANATTTQIDDVNGQTAEDVIPSALKDMLVKAQTFVDPFFYALAGIFSIVVLLGVLFIITKAAAFYHLTLFFAWIVLLLVSIALTVEYLSVSIAASVCYPSPQETLSSLSSNIDDKEMRDFVLYQLTCEGVSPLYNDTMTIFTEMDTTRSKYCSLSEMMRDPALDSQKKYKTECDSDITTAGVALAAAQTSFVSIGNQALSCKTFNEPLTRLLDDALCTDFVEGIYTMYLCKVLASFALAVTMFFLPCLKFQHEEKNENDVPMMAV